MRRLLLRSVALATLFSTTSFAADLSVRRGAPVPVPYVAAPTWSGCYVGGNLGGAFGSASISGVAGTGSADNSGFAGGGQVGCDYQFAPNWVIGFRNMFDGRTNSSSATFGSGPLAGDVLNLNDRWFDTLTGRIGYSWSSPWLLYFQGGAAWGHTNTNITAAGVQIGQISATRTGWTVGGGIEWMFLPHWSAFLEGNYMDFGTASGTAVTAIGTACAAGCGFNAKATASNVLAGINYRFW